MAGVALCTTLLTAYTGISLRKYILCSLFNEAAAGQM